MKKNVIKGKKGENLAAEFLEKQGINVLERNWRYSRLGEVDIIAKDGNTLAFIEVKTRSTANFGHPLEAISDNKLNTLNKLAEIYIHNVKEDYDSYRIDIVGIIEGKFPEITYLKGVFQ